MNIATLSAQIFIALTLRADGGTGRAGIFG